MLGDVPRWLLNRDAPLRFIPRLDLQQWRWSLAFAAACRRRYANHRRRPFLVALSYLSRDTLHALLAHQSIEFGWRKTGKPIAYCQPALLENACAQVVYQARYGARQRPERLRSNQRWQACGTALRAACLPLAMESATACNSREVFLMLCATAPTPTSVMQAAQAFVFDGMRQPSGYTEPLLHAFRFRLT